MRWRVLSPSHPNVLMAFRRRSPADSAVGHSAPPGSHSAPPAYYPVLIVIVMVVLFAPSSGRSTTQKTQENARTDSLAALPHIEWTDKWGAVNCLKSTDHIREKLTAVISNWEGRPQDDDGVNVCRISDSKFLITPYQYRNALYGLDLGKSSEPKKVFDALQQKNWTIVIRAILKDQSGTTHLVISGGMIRGFVAKRNYDVVSTESWEPVALHHGIGDSSRGGCIKETYQNLDTGTFWARLQITDSDKDGYKDIVMHIKEEDCKTHTLRTYKKIFKATGAGFKEQS